MEGNNIIKTDDLKEGVNLWTRLLSFRTAVNWRVF